MHTHICIRISIKQKHRSIYSSITTEVMPMEKYFSRHVDWEVQLTHLTFLPTCRNCFQHQDRLHLNTEGDLKVQNRRSGLRSSLSQVERVTGPGAPSPPARHSRAALSCEETHETGDIRKGQ